MNKYPKGQMSFIIIFLSLFIGGIYYIANPIKTEAEKNIYIPEIENKKLLQEVYLNNLGNYVLVHLDTNKLELKNGTTTLSSFDLVSQGKPKSYYETIGGEYINDYKEPLHLSTIGHVYMPYSIHIFGNYFIHGIPFFRNGTKVSSTYSGGCIRLNDNDIKIVYDFITPNTPIIITRETEFDFIPTSTSTETISSISMTRLMIATISLEFLTQDNEILDIDGISKTTRKEMITRLLNNTGDETKNNISVLYADALGNKNFIDAMNDKAKAIGLSNTTFENVTDPVITTQEDYGRFMQYIITYKSYLNTVVR